MKILVDFTGSKPEELKSLVYSMLDILCQVGVPVEGLTSRRLEQMALVTMAVGGIRTNLAEIQSARDGRFLKTRDIIAYENENYGEHISPGSYDDIRRKHLVLQVEAGLIINSSNVEEQATNNPTRGYSIVPAFADLVKRYGTYEWEEALSGFKEQNAVAEAELKRRRRIERLPVLLPYGGQLSLSPGEHNVLQKAVIEEFLPRFGMGAELLYVGDTSDKFLYRSERRLKEIGFFTLEHEMLPDIVAYSPDRNVVFLVEAVHCAGPMDEIRVGKLKRRLEHCRADIVFVTAFLDKKTFRQFVADIAWETEAWIASEPDHMIHFNGYKFLEIHKNMSQP